MLQKLPLGIQTFRKIREKNLSYANKKSFISKLMEESGYCFLEYQKEFAKRFNVNIGIAKEYLTKSYNKKKLLILLGIGGFRENKIEMFAEEG